MKRPSSGSEINNEIYLLIGVSILNEISVRNYNGVYRGGYASFWLDLTSITLLYGLCSFIAISINELKQYSLRQHGKLTLVAEWCSLKVVLAVGPIPQVPPKAPSTRYKPLRQLEKTNAMIKSFCEL